MGVELKRPFKVELNTQLLRLSWTLTQLNTHPAFKVELNTHLAHPAEHSPSSETKTETKVVVKELPDGCGQEGGKVNVKLNIRVKDALPQSTLKYSSSPIATTCSGIMGWILNKYLNKVAAACLVIRPLRWWHLLKHDGDSKKSLTTNQRQRAGCWDTFNTERGAGSRPLGLPSIPSFPPIPSHLHPRTH